MSSHPKPTACRWDWIRIPRGIWCGLRSNDNLNFELKTARYAGFLEVEDNLRQDYIEYVKHHNTAKSGVRNAVRDYEKEIASKGKKNPKPSIIMWIAR